ncbi:related to Probable Xaa-Pro aminopeptidase SS1G_06948 [Rhynchosporium secalis]|uniref:Xaa-Pro aminopeptidase n=1 Tax=Rhynchosporium secalis TaxID=38038 RepID=A0A1E1MRJ9_RHYSE|nr:related to Probable Xaa-Pro aminopeptidase SS1G_06948 [Rhynchosporium secalis]
MDKRPISRDSNWSFDVEEIGDVVSISRMRADNYPAKKHARSVAKHLSVKNGLIFLPGTPSQEYEDSDEPVAFRQRRYFYYLSGLGNPDCIVTFDISRDQLCAWIPPTASGRSVIYNGSTPSREEIKAKYDFNHVDYIDRLDDYIKTFVHIERSPTVFLLHKYHEAFFSRISRPSVDSKKKIQFDSTRLILSMNASRVIKSSYEIKMIRKACSITAKAHINVLKHIKTFKNESEIEAIFTATCIANQAKQQAYGIIAGSGPNASTLHYNANNECLKGRELVCLDAGCEWQCYASDVTRTFPISGEWSVEARQIYDLVTSMQEKCIEMVKPDADYRNINARAHDIATRDYLGLETHDVGDGGILLLGKNLSIDKSTEQSIFSLTTETPATSSAFILAPNMVITVEPGIYFNRYAMEEVWLQNERISKYINQDLLEKYYPVGGVRIEDDILVTEDGYENITRDIPKGDEALEIINKGLDEPVIVEKVLVKDEQRRRWFR